VGADRILSLTAPGPQRVTRVKDLDDHVRVTYDLETIGNFYFLEIEKKYLNAWLKLKTIKNLFTTKPNQKTAKNLLNKQETCFKPKKPPKNLV
jgi:hypothetical protein